MRRAELSLHQEQFSFSAGHFTIFSATEREHLHGHNYYVSVKFYFTLQENGLSFDYRHYKKKIRALCEQIDGRFMLPLQSPFLQIEESQSHITATFDGHAIPFLKRDAILLPLKNTTIEELAYWFLQGLVDDAPEMHEHGIDDILIEVYNGPKQSAGVSWRELQRS